jgi:tetratricopeptide (TPR) repeat protein
MENNKRYFFAVLIGVAVGFLAGFIAALQWQPTDSFSLASSPVPASAPSSPTKPMGAQADLPEGHPNINIQAELDRVLPLLRDKPKDFALLSQVGNLYYDGGRHAEAITYYEKALEAKPDDPLVRTDLATCYYNTKQNERALQELNKVLAVKPDFSQALYNLGVIRYFGKNDSPGAIAAWEKLLQVDPNYAAAAQLKESLSKLKAGQSL